MRKNPQNASSSIAINTRTLSSLKAFVRLLFLGFAGPWDLSFMPKRGGRSFRPRSSTRVLRNARPKAQVAGVARSRTRRSEPGEAPRTGVNADSIDCREPRCEPHLSSLLRFSVEFFARRQANRPTAWDWHTNSHQDEAIDR